MSGKVLLIIFFLLLSIGGLTAYYFSSGSPAQVFLVSEGLPYGEVMLSGIVEQDLDNTYLLELSDGSTILLSSSELAPLVGYSVTAKGTLHPPATSADRPYLVVSALESN